MKQTKRALLLTLALTLAISGAAISGAQASSTYDPYNYNPYAYDPYYNYNPYYNNNNYDPYNPYYPYYHNCPCGYYCTCPWWCTDPNSPTCSCFDNRSQDIRQGRKYPTVTLTSNTTVYDTPERNSGTAITTLSAGTTVDIVEIIDVNGTSVSRIYYHNGTGTGYAVVPGAASASTSSGGSLSAKYDPGKVVDDFIKYRRQQNGF